MIKTGQELATACKNVANNYKTLYVMGCIGAPMTAANKERYTQNHSYNQQTERTVMIKSATADTFGFDCVCFIKSLLWGWSGDKNKTYGGATYASNGVPDVNADRIITLCKDISTDFSKLAIGELLWLSGHVGIYIGNGQAVECTPAWKNGVQVTNVVNIKSGTGHKWVKHGKLPWISYDEAEKPSASGTSSGASTSSEKPNTTITGLPTLSYGNKGKSVKALQLLLIGNGISCGSCGADGEYGSGTKKAVIEYQKKVGLEPDGVAGPQTWGSLLV